MLHKIIEAIRKFLEAFRVARGKPSKGKAKRNPWPRCLSCQARVPALCTAPEPCGNGIACGCCPGHEADRPASKFETTAEKT